MRVFISHCSKDQSIARELYLQLNAEGWMDLWFIESNLKPSQNWDAEIRAAVGKADVVIALLSNNSIKREEHIYPDPHFIFDIIESKSDKDVLLIPLQLDNSMDLEESEVIAYFPKRHRRLTYSQILAKLKSHAIQQGFSTDVVVREPESEERLQWSPTKWRERGGVFGEGITDDESFEQKPSRPTPKWKRQISGGLSRLLYFSLTVLVLFVVLAVGLAINFVNTGETVNTVAQPIISRVLTIIPLPTPTLGVGSSRVSPVDGMRMVYVPAGEFIMGSDDGADDEKPARSVSLDAYWIDQFEVTNGMYKMCVDNGNCHPPDYRSANEWVHLDLIPLLEPIIRFYDDPKFENYPISRITWNDAVAYCTWAGRRLPTEAEWEKAARGTDGRTYPWGEELDCTKANVYTFPADTACAYAPTRVGSYEEGVSPYGVYDMAGNVFEFVSDDFEYAFESEDGTPLGVSVDFFRLQKGGSWITSGEVARASNRELWNTSVPEYDPNLISLFDPNGENGFRCATSSDVPVTPTINPPAPPREIVSQVSPVDGMRMMFVPDGEFIMGSDYSEDDEKPAHRVYLDAYWIDLYEITNQQYAMCVNDHRCNPPLPSLFSGHQHYLDPAYKSHPVTWVLWSDAVAYCSWTGRRLPTEAEWEKAARGEIGHTYPWGEKHPSDQLLNFNHNIGDTTPVGSYNEGVSPYGVSDMAGNVWEWVNDWYDVSYYKHSPFMNPAGPDSGNLKILRGGSWGNSGDTVRSTIRYAPLALQNLPNYIGFRCALSE